MSMKFKAIAMSALAASMGLAANAQQVTISPIPQQVEWGAKAFDSTSASYHIAGNGDADAVRILSEKLSVADGGSVEILLGEKGSAAIAEYENLIPQHDEGYYLSVGANKIVVAGYDAAGTFYGAQSLLQVLSQPEVMSVTITDWPLTPNRGVIEGYYGNPWSTTDRVRQYEFYGANKMNTYIYGPKDDPYHRDKWYELYPDAEAAVMQNLAAEATKNKVKFVWAMHPSNSIESDTDRQNAVKKFEQMYELGFRSFAIFLDDISNYDGSKQASYMNYLNANFVRLHDDVEPLILCPSEYNRSWAGDGTYLTKLGTEMDSDVQIMWTGNSVVDMINKEDCEWISNYIHRKPYIWLNYPVTDYCINHLLMGPLYGNDLDIYDMVSGFTANPMEYAEASKVALYSTADYLWNPTVYDSDASWERAIKYIEPDHAEAFRIFCINNVDLGTTYHGLRRMGESPEFKALNDTYSTLTDEAIAAYTAQFQGMVDAATELLAATDDPLTQEIQPWYECFQMQGQRGLLAMQMKQDLTAGNSEDFIAHYKEYTTLTEAADNLVWRDFSGSIKTAYPVTGTLYVEPFIKSTVASLISDFKDSGAEYPADLFPAQVLENGDYYIIYNGRYLTNASGSTYPTFKKDLDNVNPDRQYWHITLDAETGRYKIVSANDQRYINELGQFTVSDDTNPFESAWHTYTITRVNGKCAIQNGGSAGSNYWTATSSRINKGSSSTWGASNYIFEIVPVSGAKLGVQILDTDVYIKDDAGNALTMVSGSNTPVFKSVVEPADKAQMFTFSIDSTTDRFKLVSAKDGRYVNEYAVFGTNEYYPTWNTYVINELGGKHSIQNAGEAGSSYWYIDGTKISQASMSTEDSFLFTIEPIEEEQSGISEVNAAAAAQGTTFDILGRRVANPGHGIYVIDGKKVIR
jgi:hyaluronoglucosaminidase